MRSCLYYLTACCRHYLDPITYLSKHTVARGGHPRVWQEWVSGTRASFLAIIWRYSEEYLNLDLSFRKEQFSAAYVKALAAVAGLSVTRPEPDIDSEDLILGARLLGTRIRSPKLALQLKCSGSLHKNDEELAFPLPIKNYDDLRPTNLAVPRILVVLEVPAGTDPLAWLQHGDDRLSLLHVAYWTCLFGYRTVANQTTVTVRIPLRQRLTAAGLGAMMIKLGDGERQL